MFGCSAYDSDMSITLKAIISRLTFLTEMYSAVF
jgi:hypothetical protein